MKLLSSHLSKPMTSVRSESIDKELALEPGTSFRKTGVEKTYRIRDGEEFLKIACQAFTGALEQAGIEANELDLLIFAGASRAQVLPCTAALIQGEVGHSGYGCFDVDATCLGFLRALEVASSFISSGAYQTVAIVVTEGSTSHLDQADLRTYPLFGDGAVCYILSSSEARHSAQFREFCYLGRRFSTYGQYSDLCKLEGGLTRLPAWECRGKDDSRFKFQMKGRELYALSARLLPNELEKFLKSMDMTLGDCDWVVPHQASQAAMNLMSSRLGIPEGKLVNIIRDHGNQVAASIPTALHYLLEKEDFVVAKKVLLIGTGAGFGIGLSLVEITS